MKRTLIASLLILAAALPASAQHFGLTGGWYLPYGTMKDYANSGFDGGIVLQIGAPLVPVNFRFDATYGEMPGKTMTFTGGETAKSDFTTYGASANVVWTIFGATLPTKFYLIGGIGYYGVQQKYSVTGMPSIPSITNSSFGYNAGLGFRFTKFFIEARWTDITTGLQTVSESGVGGKSSLQVVPVNVGFIC